MTVFATPFGQASGNRAGEGLGESLGQSPGETAEWVRRTFPPGADQRVPDDVPIIARFGSWQAFDKRMGGMGEVYLCVPSEGTRLPVALKSFAPRLLFAPQARRAFLRECAIAIRASFAFGVLPVYGIDVYDGRPFMVMPAVLPGTRGEVNLRDLLESGPLPLAEAVYFARAVADALFEASRYVAGLVHGDLKPENILLLHGVPHVADFGLARCAARQLGGDALLGTPEYQAPEADDLNTDLLESADVYSYGVIVAEMLTGQAPGHGQAARFEKMAPVARRLLSLADECRQLDPNARPRDFSAVSAALARIAPQADWPIPQVAAMLRGSAPLVNALRRDGVAEDLLRLGQYDMVLDFVTSTAEHERGWRLWMSQGTALSLTGRDEEALGSYQRAYAALATEDTQHAWQIGLEEAASLKRLGRLDPAEALLKRLIANAPDDVWAARAANNLAALWIEAERYLEAERLLAQMLSSSPDNAIAWSNRAMLHLRAGNASKAASMLSRAVAAEPGRPEWHARLGDVLMDELGLVDEAAIAFGDALACGSLEPEVLTRALSCAFATGNEASCVELQRAIASTYGPEAAKDAEWAANLIAFWLQRKFGGPDGPAAGDLPDELEQALHAIGLSDPHAANSLLAAAAPETYVTNQDPSDTT